MAVSAYVVAVGATVAGPWLVRVLFGESYSGAGAILVVLSWANLFTSLEIARTAFLNAQNWNRVYLAMIVAGGVLNIALNLVLIPRFGGLGAAVASLVAYWFAAHGSCFLFKNLRRTGLMLTKAMLYPKVW
jgi:O-antigen/teichoic acid export membrane protein